MGTMSFGQAAISLGLVNEADVQECTQVQRKMREMGIDEPLGEIMVKKGRITAQQHQQILKKLGVQISPIPGYSLLSKIGQGGMGTVYKAIQGSVNRTVAIKIMSPQATSEPSYVARFLKEAQAAGTLNHKNLIAAIDAGAAGGYYYFVMEYVTGKSCRDLVNSNGPFDEKGALGIALQMADVLEHIHQHKMVHRDIKPENILLTPEMVVKLCDLGLAKSTTAKDQSLTQEGLTVGTPYFMSPEQIRGEKDVDIRADLYSLGATLYYLLSLRYPFEGKSAAETMSMHLKQAVPDVRKLVPKLSEDFAHVIHKLLSKNRAERYQTPKDLAEDLRTIEEGNAPRLARAHAARSNAKATSTARIERIHQKKAVSTPMIAVAAATVVAALAWLMMGARAEPEKGLPKPAPVAANTPAPPKAPEPRAPEKPSDDPVKLRKASQIFTQAEQACAAERWVEAREALNQLQKDFGGLLFTDERSKEIGKMLGDCDAKIRLQSEARNKLVQDARRDIQDGRWMEAYGRFQQLGEAEFSGEIARCRQEMEAETLQAQIRSAQADSNWTDIRQKIEELEQRYPDSQTATKRKNANRALLAKATVELDTSTLIANTFAAYVKGDWAESKRELAEIEKRRDTDAYRTNAARIKDLAEQLNAGMAKQTEDQAKLAWAAAVQGYDNYLSGRRYDDAIEVLKTFQREQAHTKLCESKKTEVELKVAEAGRRKKTDREEEARKTWTAVQREMKNQNYDAATEAINRLLGDLADTSPARTNEKALRQYKTLCEQGQGVPENVLVLLDFEDYPGVWNTHGGAKAENGTDAYQGRRAAKLTILPRGGWVSHPIQGLTSRAETVSFYARSLKKAPVAVFHVWLAVHVEDSDSISYSSPSQSIGPEWKLITIKISDFKTQNSGVKERTITAFDKVRTIGWEAAPEAGECQIQVDALKIERR